MKYNFHSIGVDVHGRTSGRIKTKCPKCKTTRRNKRDKPLSVDIDRGLGKCHYCGYTFALPEVGTLKALERQSAAKRQQQRLPSHYVRPQYDPSRVSTLSDRLTRWFVEQRCIPQDVLTTMKIGECEEYMPQTGAKGNCISFHYFEDGELVNTKYRDGAKNFKLTQGAELIPYNIDGIRGTPEVIITEGEIDALSFVAIGRTDVVSAPAGASANASWLDRFVPTHFEDKSCIYIAVDDDLKGHVLRDELLRRFGPEICRIVHFGPGCKDANEHLIRYGVESLRIALSQAEELPIEGVYTAHELADELRLLFENGLERGAETGWDTFDQFCTFELGRLAVVSGVPGDGKSEFIDELVLRLCLHHGWQVGYFSPENRPVSYHYRKIIEKLLGRRFAKSSPGMTEGMYERAVRFLAENVTHILPEEEHTLDVILQKARVLVARRGIRILVVDPLNRVEHRRPEGMTETQYLSEVLNRLSSFAMRNGCLVILVAHPRKMNRNTLTNRRPVAEMYDINGSAEFFNKADYGLIVERDREVNVVRLHVEKVKYKHLGQTGEVPFVYDVVSGRYYPCEESKDPALTPEQRIRNTQFDTSSWLPEETLFTDAGE